MISELLNFVALSVTLNFEKWGKGSVEHGTLDEMIFFAFIYSCAAFAISYLIYRYICRGMSEEQRHQKLRSFLKKYKIISWDKMK